MKQPLDMSATNDLLALLANHPAMLAGKTIHAEAFLMGLLHGLNHTYVNIESYKAFLIENGFHEHTFMSQFERQNNCRTTVISDSSEAAEQVFQNLQIEFSAHLRAYVTWAEKGDAKRTHRAPG